MDTHIKTLSGNYFSIIRRSEDYIELMSNNTGHCWVIKYTDRKEDYPYLLFHKHALSIPNYHKHWQTTSFNRAIKSIKSHDAYVLSQQLIHPYIRKTKRRLKTNGNKKIKGGSQWEVPSYIKRRFLS